MKLTVNTPEGTRDRLFAECMGRRQVQERLIRLFRQRGYREVSTPETEFYEDETGIVTLTKEWTGFYNRIAQRFFHRPRVSHIDLDGYGSFIWKLIDGKRTVYDISRKLDEAYPGMEESLPRLIKFLEILRDHHFIVWKNAGEKTK